MQRFKEWQTRKVTAAGKVIPLDTTLDVDYDPINRSLIEIIPHPQYPPTPSEIFSEGDFYTGQTPPDSPEPIESILRRQEESRLTPPYIFDPREEDYMIDYRDLITPPMQQDL